MRIRPATIADAAGIARVQVDAWRTTYRGIIPDHVLDGLDYGQREARWTQILGQPAPWCYVAEAPSGRTVGFAACGPERDGDPEYRGELWAIYLLQEVQGQGLGRRLVRTAAGRLLQAGFTTMLVWVLAANPARHFYARLGGAPVRTKPYEIGGVTLEEIGYGWTDLSGLAAQTGQQETD